MAVDGIAEFFPDAAWQRCIVHWYRNVFSHVPSTKVREIAAMLKAIHAGEDIVAARQKAAQVIEKLRGLRLATAAQLVEAAVELQSPPAIGSCGRAARPAAPPATSTCANSTGTAARP